MCINLTRRGGGNQAQFSENLENKGGSQAWYPLILKSATLAAAKFRVTLEFCNGSDRFQHLRFWRFLIRFAVGIHFYIFDHQVNKILFCFFIYKTHSLAGQGSQLLVHFRRFLLSSFFFELSALTPNYKIKMVWFTNLDLFYFSSFL